MNEHQRPDNLPEIPTRVICQYQDGHRHVRIINWNNRNAVKRFAQQSRECMLSGPDAWTKAERIPTNTLKQYDFSQPAPIQMPYTGDPELSGSRSGRIYPPHPNFVEIRKVPENKVA